MSATLTRAEFETACKLYAAKYPTTSSKSSGFLATTYPYGWIWNEHPSVSNLGYLSRCVLFPQNSTSLLDLETDASDEVCVDQVDDAAAAPVPDVLMSQQYVVFSATYQVPAFYFTIHYGNGRPLSLTEIMKTVLFRPHALPDSASATFALADPNSPFALLSQGDHPTLGTPSWYFHPCHTLEMIGEVMAEVEEEDWSTNQRLLRWMEAWFMVVGNAVDFTVGSL